MGSGFQDMLERILPPKAVNGGVFKSKVTTSKGVRQDINAPRDGRNHGGVDINYHYESGSPLGQNGINKEHPAVGSPVTGTITDMDRTGMGMITIEDSHGYKHTLMHLNNINDNLVNGMHIEQAKL